MPPNSRCDGTETISANATCDTATLRGKNVVITGGASGIGEAAVRGFVNAGAFVTFGDVAQEKGEALVSELGQDVVTFVKCDALKWADQLRLFETALERTGRVDVVVANAGIDGDDDIVKTKGTSKNGGPTEPDLSILKTNLVGVAYTAHLANLFFHKQPKDHDRCLIITASLSGYIDHPFSPQYSASKWGVRGMMRSFRSTAAVTGMRVNMIAPWYIKTAIFSNAMAKIFEASGNAWAEGEDAASAMVHLAADSRVNGRTLAIVPRDMDPRGYYDMQEDDFKPGEQSTYWQDRCMALMRFVQRQMVKSKI